METRCSIMERINYEPLLGENRELGEIPDSTLITNPRLI